MWTLAIVYECMLREAYLNHWTAYGVLAELRRTLIRTRQERGLWLTG